MTAIGTPAQMYGNTAAVEQGTRKAWAYFQGERVQLTFKGPATAVHALYESYKSVAGSNPTYDGMAFDAGRGIGILLVDTVEDGEKFYQLFAIEERRSVEAAPYFQESNDDGAAMTAAEIMAVFNAFDRGGTEASIAASPTTKQSKLYKKLAHGTTECLMTRWALRESQKCSKRSTVSATHATVDHVEAPPDTSAVNTLIGELPAGEWLRRGTIVQQMGGRTWELVTEWWWAVAWDADLYPGGTLVLT